MKLTANSVRTAELPAGKSEVIFFDDDIPGFGLRLRAQGSRTFIFQYKLGRAQYRLNLGKVEALNFAEVRKMALQHYASVKRGENPADDKAAALRQASETFKFYVDRYLGALRQCYRPRSFTEIQRHLLKHARSLHGMQLAKISRRSHRRCRNYKRRWRSYRKPRAIFSIRILHLGDAARTSRK
jgi:Arm DNA-binding domain